MGSTRLISYPAKIAVSKEKSDKFYVRLPDYVAVHHEPNTLKPEAVTTIGEEISVLRADPASIQDSRPDEQLTPVYALGGGERYAVPTGLVFVLLDEGTEIGQCEQQIRNAGYEVVRRLEYAPNSAWLRSRSGEIDEALNGLKKLDAIPQIKNVEPQMLMASVRR